MQLSFEEVAVVGSGNYPDFVEFERTEGELFFLDGGKMYGTPTEKLHGYFDSPVWLDTHEIGPVGDTGMTNLELKTLSGFGIVGSYTTPTTQKLLIYEFQHDMSRYLSSGSIKHSIDSPISTFSLTLDNPIDKETEFEGPVVLNEHQGLVSPGAKVIFRFTMGEDASVDMGVFYVDDTDFKVRSDTASLNGRNLIGKALKDQTINEEGHTPYTIVSEIFEEFLRYANLLNDQYIVQTSGEYRRYEFEPNKDILACMEEMFKTLVTWKIEELVDGTIVIGESDFSGFPSRSTYQFQRDKDIFSRNIKMDDAEAYRKVCVHDKDWVVRVYATVDAYTGWNLQSNKTLFVSVPEGTSTTNATAIANELALRLKNVGKVETFEGPFRPQLLVGDSAVIVDSNGQNTLGLITEVVHSFGKSGFKTTFTVDSGGRLGRGRLKDFIEKINRSASAGSIAYEDIVPPDPEPAP
jgi:hypothetical protein